MDLCADLEVFIPLESEVKRVPLRSLPTSVLRRISISVCDQQGSDSDQCIWICPAVIRHEGQKAVTHTPNNVKESMTSLLGARCCDPVRVPFVSANHTAYKLLKETMPGTKVSHTQQTCVIPHGSAAGTHQVSVVIYHRRIFLSIKKSSKKPVTHHPQPAARSCPPSTPPPSHVKKIQEDVVNQQNQPETTVQRKRAHSHTHPEPELQGNQTSICKRPVNKNKEDVCDHGGDPSVSKALQPVPYPADSMHTVDELQGQATLKLAGFQSGRNQDQNEDEEPDKCCGDCDMCDLPNQSTDNMNTYLHFSDYDQSEEQSWSRGESTFLSPEVDFQALEQDEIIARMEARLRQNEAALHSLHTPK